MRAMCATRPARPARAARARGDGKTGRIARGGVARARARARDEGTALASRACVAVLSSRACVAVLSSRACVAVLASVVLVERACAFSGDIALSDVTYAPTACPENQYAPDARRTTCLRFEATARNDVRGRRIESANVFGFVDDAEGNSAATVNADGTSRTVLSAIEGEIPSGESRVSFVVTVFKDALERGPLRLRGFKAVGSVADVDKRFKPFDACEVDPESCF